MPRSSSAIQLAHYWMDKPARCARQIGRRKSWARFTAPIIQVKLNSVDPSVLLRSFFVHASSGYTEPGHIVLGPKILHQGRFQPNEAKPVFTVSQQCQRLTHLHRNGHRCLQFTLVGLPARLCNLISRTPAPHDAGTTVYTLLALQ